MAKYSALREIRKGYRHGVKAGYKVRPVGGLRSVGVTLSPAALSEAGISLGDTVYEYVDTEGNILLIPEKNMPHE